MKTRKHYTPTFKAQLVQDVADHDNLPEEGVA
jgi:hypothetical protein